MDGLLKGLLAIQAFQRDAGHQDSAIRARHLADGMCGVACRARFQCKTHCRTAFVPPIIGSNAHPDGSVPARSARFARGLKDNGRPVLPVRYACNETTTATINGKFVCGPPPS
jgi:hypothetical protein